MKELRNGAELAIIAVEREVKRLEKIAKKAEAEINETMDAGLTIIDARREALKVVKGSSLQVVKTKALEDLAEVEKKALAAGKRDLLPLIDKSTAAKIELDCLKRELSNMKRRHRIIGA